MKVDLKDLLPAFAAGQGEEPFVELNDRRALVGLGQNDQINSLLKPLWGLRLRLLKVRSKHLTPAQLSLLLRKRDACYPLYLKVAVEELRLGGDFGSDGQIINHIIAGFPETLTALFGHVLSRIEGEVDEFCGGNHALGQRDHMSRGYDRHASERHPPNAIDGVLVVEHCLSLLAASVVPLYQRAASAPVHPPACTTECMRHSRR